jgi:hypothetical protein
MNKLHVNKEPKYKNRRRAVGAVATTVVSLGAAFGLTAGTSDKPVPDESCEVTIGKGNHIAGLEDAASKLGVDSEDITSVVDEFGKSIAQDVAEGKRGTDTNYGLGGVADTAKLWKNDVISADHVTPKVCSDLGGTVLKHS